MRGSSEELPCQGSDTEHGSGDEQSQKRRGAHSPELCTPLRIKGPCCRASSPDIGKFPKVEMITCGGAAQAIQADPQFHRYEWGIARLKTRSFNTGPNYLIVNSNKAEQSRTGSGVEDLNLRSLSPCYPRHQAQSTQLRALRCKVTPVNVIVVFPRLCLISREQEPLH